MPKQSSVVSRRAFLSAVAAGLAWPQRPPAPPSSLEMIVRSTRPEDREMPVQGFRDFITPIEHFFVRTHVFVPRVDLAEWRLTIDGHVSKALTLSMQDIRSMPSAEVVSVLECAGNGRSFYEPRVAGLQWANGAVGNARWRGVRLRDVLQRAGMNTGTAEVAFDGVDVPIGTMADFQRSIPLSKALHPATLLAYEMNGQTLPAQHGFPLRVVVPGWAGNSWVKWVRSIRALNQPLDGFWMKNAYLQPSTPIPPGSLVPPEQMRPVTRLRVKSIISNPEPGSWVDAGTRIMVRGAAWSDDDGRVEAVDISTDRGQKWKPARFVGPRSQFGWRLWEFPWTPPFEGSFTLLARARDASGSVQPLEQAWNPSGYLWNVVSRTDVSVGKAAAAPLAAQPADVPAPEGFREACTLCHEEDVIRQQRLTRAQWERELNKMTSWGARVQPERMGNLLDYLERLSNRR